MQQRRTMETPALTPALPPAETRSDISTAYQMSQDIMYNIFAKHYVARNPYKNLQWFISTLGCRPNIIEKIFLQHAQEETILAVASVGRREKILWWTEVAEGRGGGGIGGGAGVVMTYACCSHRQVTSLPPTVPRRSDVVFFFFLDPRFVFVFHGDDHVNGHCIYFVGISSTLERSQIWGRRLG